MNRSLFGAAAPWLMLAGSTLACLTRADCWADDLAPAITPVGGPIRLFNGKNLDGCYTWLKDTKRDDPRQVFRVTDDGMLHVTGDGWGGIVTNDRYRDYHLVVEFKWGSRTWQERENAARDSGILIHSNGVDGGYEGTWMPAIEVQIIEGGVGDFILVTGNDEAGQPVPVALSSRVRKVANEVIWQDDGLAERFDAKNRRRVNWFGRDPAWKDAKGFRGTADVESPPGKWTRIDVMADQERIRVFVNGTKVNEAFGASPRAGRIQLQSELAEIFFRRWELWPVGQGPKPAAADRPAAAP